MNEHSIFLAVLEIADPAERSAYLDRACAGDAEKRSQVEQLLKAHQESGRFKDRPAPQRQAKEPAPPSKLGETQDETPADDTDIQELTFLIPSDKPGVLGRLGRYEVLDVIGRGGMGVVLRAFDEHLHRMVAIKVMAAHLATSATARKRFSREARTAAAVCHDHIVTIHAVEEAHGLPYLVMKYVAGVTLKQRLDRAGPLPLPEILRIGMETASGLAAAHAKGLIHRDIKPANILLEAPSPQPLSPTEGERGDSLLPSPPLRRRGVGGEGARVKITDFGLARAADDSSLTQSGVVAGTPDYMSPEQARGETLDARTDLFSLGSVLYAMCTGRPPFHAGDTMAILQRVCEEAPTPIRTINPEVPDWLAAIIEKLHAKDPAQRFQSAAEVAELLNLHLAHVLHPPMTPLPSHSASGEHKPPAAGPPLARRRRWAVAVTILVLFLGGLALTEATGVTKLAATAIRVFTPNGTSVVEGDDPSTSSPAAATAPATTTTQAELAVERAEKALEKEPNSGVLLASLGTAYYRAGRWQEAIRTLLKADEAGHGANVSFSPFVLAMAHWRAGDQEKARQWYGLGLVWLARQAAPAEELLRARAEVASLLGMPEQLSAEQAAARSDWLKYLDLVVQTHPEAVWACMSRARVFEERKQWDKAAADYRRAVEIGEKRVAEPPPDALRRQRLAWAHQELARVLLYHLSQPEEAAKSRQRQVDLFKQLVKEFPKDPGNREQLGHAYRWRAFDFEKVQQPAQAEEAFGQAIEYLEQLVRDFQDRTNYYGLLSDTYDRYRKLLAANGKAKEAGEAFDNAIRVLASFPEERATTPAARASLADLHHRRGNLLREARRLDDAEIAYCQAIAVRAALADQHPTERSHRQELGRNHNWLGIVLTQKGQPQEAEQEHRLALHIYEQLTRENDPSSGHWHRRELAWTCLNLAEVLEKERQFNEAMELYRRAGELSEKLAAERADSTYPYWACQGYGRLIGLLTSAGRKDEAKEVCDKLLAFKPPLSGQSLNGGAWSLVAGADPKSRAPDLALELAQKAVEREPKAAHIINTLGVAQYRAGHWKAAITTLMKSQEIGSQFFDANAYFLAMAHWQLEEKDQARKWYAAALVWMERWNSKSDELLRFRAEAASLLGLPEQLLPEQEQAKTDEVKLYTLVLEANPESAWPYQHRGRAFGRAEQWDKAVADFSRAIELKPDYWLNWADRGWARRGLRQLDQAIADYSKALELDATVDWVWYQRGQTYADLGQWDKALPDFSKAIELKPGNASSWNLRGVAHSRLGQKEKALADYVRASELNPKVALYWSNQGSVGAELKRFDQAVAAYSKAIELKAEEASYWNNRGNTFAELGQWDKAALDFAKAVELKEDDPSPHYRLALVRLQLGDRDGYRKVCAGMLERFGSKADSEPAYWTAWTCVLGPDAVSDWKPLVDLVEKSLAADPKNFDKLQHLGAVLYRAGRFEEAAKRLTEAEAAFPEAKNPRSTIIYTWLFQAMTRHCLGQTEEAKRLFTKAVEAIDQPPDKSKDANAGTWNRRLTLQLLRREAQARLDKE